MFLRVRQVAFLLRLRIFIAGRPIQFGNLSFVWRSPEHMSGPVKFKGSVVYNGEFLEIEAKINGSRIKNNGEIPFKPFPVILKKSFY